jgi:hypothetical protein
MTLHLLRTPKKSLWNITLFLFSLTLALPLQMQGQSQDLDIFVTCVEDLGTGQYMAYFGYNNPYDYVVNLKSNQSYLQFNEDKSKTLVLNEFQPGMHDRALSAAFDATGKVTWYLNSSSFGQREARATSSSNLCPAPLDVIPYYAPPEGGKVDQVKITAELVSLYNTYSADPSAFEPVSLFIFQFRIPGLSGYPEVMIEVVSEPGEYDAMITEISSMGFDLLTEGPSPLKATGWFPIARLMELNGVIPLKLGRPVYPGVSNSYVDPNLGTVTSEGDRAMRGDFARLGFDVDGSGVKIGVISNSYDTKNQAAGNVSSGDLPGVGNPNGYATPVDVVMDVPAQYGVLSDEGRAMLQIIHDVAPGAELAFRTGYLGENDMANGIQELIDAGCDIIVEDLSYLDEPFFADGVISQAIDNAVAQGVTFFSSAGNFGPWSIGQQFLQGPDITSIPGKEHDWSGGAGDVFASVSLEPGVIYTAVLQWDDGSDPTMETTLTDMDFYFTNGSGSTVLGFNHVNTGLFPIEVIPFYVDQDTVVANMVVSIASGPDVPVNFKLILFRGGEKFHFLEYGGQGTSTIVGHPNALGTITVGAVRYDKNQVYSPDTYSSPEIMSFSSVGGTPVNGIVRNKPDITAPNGVNTTVELYPGADWSGDSDELPNFFGTSAASPHAAAVAALIKEAWAKFEPGTPLTPEDIRTILRTTALDMETPGDDFISGSGFIQAHKAIMSFANPTPYLTNVIPEDGVIPGESLTPFSFEMQGGYFTDDTEVLVDGVPLSSGVVIQDENTVSVDGVSFLGYAGVQASLESISSSGLDGGTSEMVYFTDPIVRTILISADDKTKTYGEVMPEFTASFALVTEYGDTISFAQAIADTLMFQSEADRLSVLSYSSSGDPLSGTGFYTIFPAIDPPYDPENPLTLLDQAIAEKFDIVYDNGALAVDPLAINITPEDVEIVYGQSLSASDLSFVYTIADSSVVIDDPVALLNAVEASHMSSLSNGIAIVHGVTIINGIPMVNGQVLFNGIPMVNGRAMVNGIEVLVETDESGTTNVYIGGELVPEEGPVPNGIPMVNGRPMVNLDQIVNGRVLVNGEEITIENGFITELNGIPMVNKVPVESGIPMVNGRALVNGHEVIVTSSSTTVDGAAVSTSGVIEVNGIPMVNGIPIVNLNTVTNGRVMVNSLEISVENGIPMVNGRAMVNGIPMVNGRVLVNSLDVSVTDGEITQVKMDGEIQTLSGDVTVLNGIPMVNGRVLVNGRVMVNGRPMVNALIPTDSYGNGDDVVNLENVSLMASDAALANGRAMVNGRPMVNGLEGIDPEAFSIATGTTLSDGTIIYESSPIINDMALVNGRVLVNGTAMVNGRPMVNGIPMVNEATNSDSSNFNALILFDASQFGTEDTTVVTGPVQPTSFITGTSVGVHAIIPGSLANLSVVANYYPAQLTILPTTISVSADNQSKNYGDPDPELTYQAPDLLGDDTWEGSLNRVAGEDAGTYGINQGTLNAGSSYIINFTPGTMTIDPVALSIDVSAENKVYDGTSDAVVTLSDNRLPGDQLNFTYVSALFSDKNAGTAKAVFVDGIAVEGSDALNYTANTSAETTADITARDLVIGITASDKTYDGTKDAETAASIVSGYVDGDDLTATSSNGVFENKNVGTGKQVTADVSLSGTDAVNYTANTSAESFADITARDLVISITASDKTYDGTTDAETAASIVSGYVDGDNLTAISSNGVFEDKNVGTGKLVTADVSVSGTDAGNYNSNLMAETTASIFALEVSVSLEQDFYYINEKDPLPDFQPVYDGLIPGDILTVDYSVLRDSDLAPYNETANGTAGSYTVTPVPAAVSNYTFLAESSILQVNPYGPGVRAVKPSLNCIEELSPGYYVAHFAYSNDNGADIFIPHGPDNLLEGSGIDWAASDDWPELFLTTGGTFDVYFDGTEITWTVTSRTDKKTVRQAAGANASSTKCPTNIKSASVSTGVEDLLGPQVLEAYPNPVSDLIYLRLDGIEGYQMIHLYDLSGKSYPVSPSVSRSDLLEIDMSSLPAGPYFIRVVMEDTATVVPVVKK